VERLEMAQEIYTRLSTLQRQTSSIADGLAAAIQHEDSVRRSWFESLRTLEDQQDELISHLRALAEQHAIHQR
jgi:hypothetical protein